MPTQLRPGCWLIELTGVNAYLVEDVVGETPNGETTAAREEPISVDLSEDGATEAADEDDSGDDGESSVEAGTDEEVTDDTEGDVRTVLTLVDAGMPFDADAVREAIEETGHTLADVERVLVTHYDVDHVGGLSRLDLPNATVYMGSPDAEYLTGRRSPPLDGHKTALQRLSKPFVSTDLDVEVVGDGDRVGSFTVYETPGHTEGHVAYVSSDLSVAFVGDLVRESDGELTPSPWVISHDTDAVAESIHDLADREPAVEVLGMGHGVPFLRGGAVRLAQLGQKVD
ncbi:MBL fold metallo-hydrolase [Halomarina oriensis]|uniref:MBL fold metallo-hydrolase n=1 Tax=Halomarina oriensis TaxID=671145 RepID=A0A6B0GQX3_9EURY|nr:MBL fold metallo-hydrolase [Halomarina oriensis]MWG35063.1 MBL fold metallo-hydrolase [Halomarina oriensis]